MFTQLLAAIEADINKTHQKIQDLAVNQATRPKELQELRSKKQQLVDLAMQYVGLENRYREVAGLNSIY